MVTESYPWAAMISAVKALPIEHQPLIVGLPWDQSCLSLFGVISEHHLCQFHIETVADALDAAFASHARKVRAAKGSFRGRESEAVDAHHSGLQLRDRSPRPGRRTRDRIGRKAHYAGVGALDRFVVGPESRDCCNWSEVLLRHDLHGVGDVGQHGRLEEAPPGNSK